MSKKLIKSQWTPLSLGVLAPIILIPVHLLLVTLYLLICNVVGLVAFHDIGGYLSLSAIGTFLYCLGFAQLFVIPYFYLQSWLAKNYSLNKPWHVFSIAVIFCLIFTPASGLLNVINLSFLKFTTFLQSLMFGLQIACIGYFVLIKPKTVINELDDK